MGRRKRADVAAVAGEEGVGVGASWTGVAAALGERDGAGAAPVADVPARVPEPGPGVPLDGLAGLARRESAAVRDERASLAAQASRDAIERASAEAVAAARASGRAEPPARAVRPALGPDVPAWSRAGGSGALAAIADLERLVAHRGDRDVGIAIVRALRALARGV